MIHDANKGHFRELNRDLAPARINTRLKCQMRRPGLEPGTPAWKADMLTPTPTTQ